MLFIVCQTPDPLRESAERMFEGPRPSPFTRALKNLDSALKTVKRSKHHVRVDASPSALNIIMAQPA